MNKKQLETSFLNGLEFCIRFYEDTKCFKYECIQWIICLSSMVCNPIKNKTIRQKVYSAFEEALIRVCNEIDKIEVDYYEYFLLFYSCSLIKGRRQKNLFDTLYSYFSKKYSRKSIPNHALKYLKENNYDDLSDEVIDHMYLNLCRKKWISKFPKDHFKDYKRAIEKLDYKTLKHDSDLDYHMTHVIYTYNQYGCIRLRKTKFIKTVETYLKERSETIFKDNDIDLIAETLECFVVLNSKSWLKKNKRKFLKKILSKQRKSGAWTCPDCKSCYDRFHGTWTCINLLYLLIR